MAAFYSIAMANQIEKAAEAFSAVDGITARSSTSNHDLLVKVTEEDSIGMFYKVARETGVNLSATTRNDLPNTVLDSWADL